MRTFVIMLALAGALAACSNSEAAERAQFIAAGLNAISPKSLGEGIMMNGAKAAGSTLTLSFGGAPASELAAPDFDGQMRKLVCDDPNFRKALGEGVDFDLAMSATDGTAKTVSVKSC